MIEGAPARACDVHVNAVVSAAAVLAAVEAEAQEVPLHSPGLRDAVENESAELRCAQERGNVASSEETNARHRCSVSLIDEVVNLSRLEATLKPDVLRRGLYRACGRL